MESLKTWKQMASEDPSIAAIGGYGYVRSELANKVLTGTYYSLGIALLVIFILLSIIFRSAIAGLLGIIPLSSFRADPVWNDGAYRGPAGYCHCTALLRNDRRGC